MKGIGMDAQEIWVQIEGILVGEVRF